LDNLAARMDRQAAGGTDSYGQHLKTAPQKISAAFLRAE